MKKRCLCKAMLPLLAALLLGSCQNPMNPRIDQTAESVKFSQILPLGAEACCTHTDTPGGGANLIDDNVTTWWRAKKGDGVALGDELYGGEGDFGHNGRGHYITIDLGQVYKNITRLTYMPNYEADMGWADGYPANRNGVIQDFEVYVTDTRLQEGEYTPYALT